MAGRNSRFVSSTMTSNRFDLTEKVTPVPSSTLKRHPKMELSKTDLIQLLSYLEGELQGREVVIAALKAEKAKQLMYQAKYGRFGLTDPFSALQRDSEGHKDKSFDENAIKNMYENQLVQLEKLISVQRKAQIKMKDQIGLTDKKYHKACHELDEERKKHAQDMAQGDDVTYALEKERERLRNEIDFEKNNVKKLEKELKKTKELLDEERKTSSKHKQVAIMLIKERRQMAEKLIASHNKCRITEAKMGEEQCRVKNMAEGLVEESKKSLKMEAAMEKHLAELDTEKQQLKMRLIREENKSGELQCEVDRLQQQIYALQKQFNFDKNREGPKTIEIKSSVTDKTIPGMSQSGTLVSQAVPKTQPKVFRNTPPHTPPEMRKNMQELPEKDIALKSESNVKRAILQLQNVKSDKPERPTEVVLSPGSRVNLNTATGSGTTVFSTPSGGKISFTVGGNCPRKISPAGRGTPPPVPPNKPTLSASTVQKVARSPPVNSTQKCGLSVGKERSIEGAKPVSVSSGVIASPSNVIVTSDGSTARKVSQQLTSNTDFQSDYVSIDMDDVEIICLDNSGSGCPPFVAPATFHSSPLFVFAERGDLDELHKLVVDNSGDVNQTLKDGTSVVHCVAENGHEECLNFLLGCGLNVNVRRDDKLTPLHAASAAGHKVIVETLLTNGAHINDVDEMGRSSIYWAVRHGHVQACQALIQYGSHLDVVNKAGWNIIHAAVNGNYSSCLMMLLEHLDKRDLTKDLLNAPDEDGLTPAHLAVFMDSRVCFEMLVRHPHFDRDRKDNQGRTISNLAFGQCAEYLNSTRPVNQECTCSVFIELDQTELLPIKQFVPFVIGSTVITMETSWSSLEGTLSDLFLQHLTTLSTGFQSPSEIPNNNFNGNGQVKKSPDAPPMLGLTLNSIKYFHLGQYCWSPGTRSYCSPYDIVVGNNVDKVSINLFSWDDNCQDSLAYEMLLPATTLQNYLRLAEQYRCVVFYGPGGTGKSYLARRLADCIQIKEQQKGNKCDVVHISVDGSLKQQDFTSRLVEKGILVENNDETYVPVLVLDDLSKICLSEVLRDLLMLIEIRGTNSTISFTESGHKGEFFLPSNCYIIGTMDRSRSTGIELSVQQLFRWVHCRIDSEPYCSLLSRYYCRTLLHIYGGHLPSPENELYRAIVWVAKVWRRLNDVLGKLGLPEIVFGPTHFLSCPIGLDKVTSIFRWMSLFWNRVVVPLISDAVLLSQEKIADTTLYVLLQRAVMPGCPLVDQEHDDYITNFQGHNELEMLLKADNSQVGSSFPADGTAEPSDELSCKSGFQTWSGTDSPSKRKKPHKANHVTDDMNSSSTAKLKPSRIPNLVSIHKAASTKLDRNVNSRQILNEHNKVKTSAAVDYIAE